MPAFDPADHFTIYVDNTNNSRTALVFSNPRPEGREPPPPPPCGSCDAGWLSMTATLRDKRGATDLNVFWCSSTSAFNLGRVSGVASLTCVEN